MKRQITVVGGGPAGMAAALFAARRGACVTLLERNEKLGKKLYITGKGRCNVTNAADDLLPFIPRNPKFLHAAFSCFGPAALRALLAENGCETKVERGGRVFPVSEKASDVTRAWQRALESAGVDVRLNARVSSLEPLLSKGPVVLATGGVSYPSTGSTGDGYRLAAEVGHSLVEPKASLIPLITKDDWPRALSGLSLKNVRLCAWVGKKERFSELGEMLFTHFGISGPLVLSLSSHIIDEPLHNVRIALDMKPGLTPEQLVRRLQRDFDESPRRQIAHVLPQLVPSRMAALLPGLCGLSPEKPVGQITREERGVLAALLKAVPLLVTGFRPVEEAIVTRGGIPVREVDPGTMCSKLCEGLYFAGELLDVDAHTGGFNLQIAFSTGALAGWSAGYSSR